MSLRKHLFDSNDVQCARCRGRLVLDTETGETVCSTCGMVAGTGQNILTSKAWPVSTGMEHITESSSNMHDLNLSTLIYHNNVDVNGRQIEGYEINRIRRLNDRVSFNDPKTRNLMKARSELGRIIELLGISNAVAERALYIYKKALKKNLVRGRSITGLIAAATYIACRDMNVPCSIDQIQYLTTNVKKKTLGYYCKLLLREMHVSVDLPSPSRHISRIAKSIGLSTRVERKALEILDLVKDHEMLMGKRPLSLAAATLYLASIQNGEGVSQLRIANAANLTTSTIRKRCLEIAKSMEIAKPSHSNHIEDTELTLHSTKVQMDTATYDPDLIELR